MHFTREKDFWAGVVFLMVGSAFAIGSTNYRFGTSASPGPAYFPMGLGILLALVGVIVVIKALLTPENREAVGRFAWRPLIVIVASVVLFGELLPRLGLLLALPLMIIVAAFASDEFHWRDAILNAVILTFGCWAIFIKGLGLIIPVLPAFGF